MCATGTQTERHTVRRVSGSSPQARRPRPSDTASPPHKKIGACLNGERARETARESARESAEGSARESAREKEGVSVYARAHVRAFVYMCVCVCVYMSKGACLPVHR